MAWKVKDTRVWEASPDRDTVAAALVTVERDGEEHSIVVELAGTAHAAGLDARDAVRGYLEDDDPPRHLIVTTTGAHPAQ